MCENRNELCGSWFVMHRTSGELLQFTWFRRPEDIHTGADASFHGLPTGAALFCNLQINVFCNRSERLRVVGSNLNSAADTVEAIVVCGNTKDIEKVTQSLVHTDHLLESEGSGSKSAISHI